VDNGDQLLFSRYLQGLASLALNLGLDKILSYAPSPPNSVSSKPSKYLSVHRIAFLLLKLVVKHFSNTDSDWQWLNALGMTIRTADSLITKSQLPQDFVTKFKIGIVK